MKKVLAAAVLGTGTVWGQAPGGARIQLAVASPDPSVAGDRVNFQVLVANTGGETWKKGEYFFEAEIYDATGTYITKTQRLTGDQDVEPGGSALAFLDFRSRQDYEGRYFFRVALVHRGQRLVTGDLTPFQVTALVLPPRPPPKIALGGNVILSYQNVFRPGPKNDRYLAGLNTNLIGRLGNAPISFNGYAFSREDKRFRLDNFLFQYFSRAVELSGGDIQPQYNSLVLSGAGMRGLWATGRFSRATLSTVLALNAEGKEGTSTTNGTFDRYLVGGSAKYELPVWAGEFSASSFYSLDDAGSLKQPGPSLAAIQDTVFGGGTRWHLADRVMVSGEFARSVHRSDRFDPTTQTVGNAFRLGTGLVGIRNLSLTGHFTRVGPTFNSVGAPLFTQNRRTWEAAGRISWPDRGFLSFSFNRWRDNLREDPKINTTRQTLFSPTVGFVRRGLPSLTFGYSLTRAVGANRDLLDNRTDTFTAGISYSRGRNTLSLSGSRVVFDDRTDTADDLRTHSATLGLTVSPLKPGSFSLGYTLANIRNRRRNTLNRTRTFSASTNWAVAKKASVAAWGSLSFRKDPLGASPADSRERTGTVEFTYAFLNNLTWTAGYTRTASDDFVSSSNSFREHGANTRLSVSF